MLSAVSYQEQIAQIATDVFGSMLQMGVAACDEPAPLTGGIAAAVRFEGVWNGALLIQCSLDQAFELAGRLMPIDRPASFDEDAKDALGEVANMIGGNLKALLPPKTALSVPEIFSVAPVFTRPEDHVNSRVTLQSDIGAFSITLLEQSLSPTGERGEHPEEKRNG